jgi:hypothetical protein
MLFYFWEWVIGGNGRVESILQNIGWYFDGDLLVMSLEIYQFCGIIWENHR